VHRQALIALTEASRAVVSSIRRGAGGAREQEPKTGYELGPARSLDSMLVCVGDVPRVKWEDQPPRRFETVEVVDAAFAQNGPHMDNRHAEAARLVVKRVDRRHQLSACRAAALATARTRFSGIDDGDRLDLDHESGAKPLFRAGSRKARNNTFLRFAAYAASTFSSPSSPRLPNLLAMT
jgi:hypothetical protein